MAGDLVLFTGASGFIGFRTLIEALSKGYHVRAVVRSEEKQASLTDSKLIQPYLSQLSFVVVPDLTKDGAFDEAVKGVDYIVHLASPLPRKPTDDEDSLVKPAVQGTLSILYSALKSPTTRRVVITSSAAAVAPDALLTGVPVDEFSAETLSPDPQGPFQNPVVAYFASKKLAFHRTNDFITKERPKFQIINVMPSFVLGENLLVTTRAAALGGSNGLLLEPLVTGKDVSITPGMTVHVDDVAFVHIAALSSTQEGHQNYGLNYNGPEGIKWDAAIAVIKEKFPGAIEQGVLHTTGSHPSLPTPFNASHTEAVFGFKHKNFEQQVEAAVGQYVSLA